MDIQYKKPQRILIIGSPGAGKSTLARKLALKLNLPLIYLDMIYHQADHTVLSSQEFDQRLKIELNKPEWIIDGNYARTLSERLKKADLVIYLDYPTELCLKGIRERIGKPREDMPWQTETELDPEFEEFVRNFDQTKPELEEKLKSHPNIQVLHSRKEAEEFLEEISRNFSAAE